MPGYSFKYNKLALTNKKSLSLLNLICYSLRNKYLIKLIEVNFMNT